MTLRFTAKSENIKSIMCLRHGQMSIKCIFVPNQYNLQFGLLCIYQILLYVKKKLCQILDVTCQFRNWMLIAKLYFGVGLTTIKLIYRFHHMFLFWSLLSIVACIICCSSLLEDMMLFWSAKNPQRLQI
jgi:hypothetical protein